MYGTVEEITEAFKSKGWIKPDFEAVTLGAARKMLGDSADHHYAKGGKLFRMRVTGNIFDSNGNIVIYNIPVIQNLRVIPAQKS